MHGTFSSAASHQIPRSVREAAQGWSLIAPLYLLVAGVIVLPELWALYLSFTEYSVGRDPTFIGTSNYVDALTSAELWLATLRTIVFVAIAVGLEMLAGLALACLLARRVPVRALFIAALIAPMAMSHSVTATIWAYLLDYNLGPVNYLLQIGGFQRVQWLSSAATALVAVSLIEFWAGMPHVLVMLYPVRGSFSREIYEAAELDGATNWQLFRHITWPMIKPAFFVSAIFRIIVTMRAFGTVWILTKGGPLDASEILSVYLYKVGFVYWEFGRAAAIAWIMLLMTAAASSIYVIKLYRTSFAPHA
jgi:multiple sugar transport system permease protein